MRYSRSRHRRSRPSGKVLIIVAFSLPAMLGLVALVLDGGILLAQRRHVQAAADAGALAGAVVIFNNYPTAQGGYDSNAEARARQVALENFRESDRPNVDITVNIPPRESEGERYNGRPGYVEVIVRYRQPRSFSRIWGSEPISQRRQAIARGSWARPRGGVAVLHPTASASFSFGGNSNNYLNVQGGELFVNSNNSTAISGGGGARAAANGFFVTGDPGMTNQTPSSLMESNGVTQSNNINSGSLPILDPFRSLPEPTVTNNQTSTLIKKMQGNNVTAGWTQNAQPRINDLVAAGQLTSAEATGFTDFYLLSPGRYGSLPNFTSSSTLVLLQQAPGGGIFNLTEGITVNSAYLMMDPRSSGGIMLYNTGSGSNAGISLGGQSGKVWLVPPTSGTYQNMVIFQSRLSSTVPPISISGGARFDIAGSIYSARGELKLSGGAAGNKVGSQQVTNTLTISGGANITVTYDSGQVANQRVLTLVE